MAKRKRKRNKNQRADLRKEGSQKATKEFRPSGTSINLSEWIGASSRFVRHNQRVLSALLLLVLVLIPFYTSVHFRMYPATLPITEKWAADTILNSVRNDLNAQITKQYPNLPPERKREVIEQELQKILAQQKSDFEAQVSQLSEQFKERLQDDTGQTYLLAIDPYFYLRRAELIVKTGNVCDEIRNGWCWDNHMLAPLGVPTKKDFHSSFGAWLYKAVSVFKPNLTVKNVFFYIPVLIASLSVIPAFFVGRRFGGNVAGFTAAMLVATNTSFLGRTPAGFSDTDAYNVFFPLLIIWLVIESYEAKKLLAKFSLALLASLSVGIYSRAWAGWWYSFDFVVLALLGTIVFQLFRKLVHTYQERRNIRFNQLLRIFTEKALLLNLALLFFFVLASFVLTDALGGSMKSALTGPISFISIKEAAHETLWPNVFTTVAELNEANLPQIIGSFGSKFVLFLAFLGIGLSLLPKKTTLISWIILGTSLFWSVFLVSSGAQTLPILRYLIFLALLIAINLLIVLFHKESTSYFHAFLVTIWLLGTIYPSTKGVRFIFLALPAVSVSAGLALGKLNQLLRDVSKKNLNISPWFATACIWLFIFALFNPVPLVTGTSSKGLLIKTKAVALGEVPSMNDAWVGALTSIKENSEPDAIINSWWDFGHWFKYWADRAVTFDGGSQNSPMAHWIGKTLLTPREDEAVGILRMLDCGSNNAYERLLNTTQDPLKTIDLLYDIIPRYNHNEAKRVLLAEGISPKDAEDVLDLTHCNPPEDFFITSQDMVGKAGVWGHFGSWNFTRAKIYNDLKKLPRSERVSYLQNTLNISRSQAQQTIDQILSSDKAANNWIAPWPGYVSQNWFSCKGPAQNETGNVTCKLGIGIGNVRGANGVIDEFVVNPERPEEAKLKISLRNPSTGAKINEIEGFINALVIARENSYDRFDYQNATVGFGGLLDVAGGNYRILIADPLHISSTFTKLFYLDGRGMSHFQKFHDTRAVNGWRIIVWKVNWEGEGIPAPSNEGRET